MKHCIWALTAALTMLSSCCCGSDGIKVMSYNIRHMKAADGANSWNFRKEATPAMINSVHPDVFGIQEAYKDQVDYILESCPDYAGYGVGRNDGLDANEHMTIFYDTTRIGMLEHGTYWLSETPDVPSIGWGCRHYRTATWALMYDRKADRYFYFVNTHLDHKSKEAQIKGLALIRERIAAMNPSGYPLVLTGDFNVLPDDEALAELGREMLDTRVVARRTTDKGSFHGWGKCSKIIDYIWFDGFSSCSRFDVLDRKFAGKPFISDHYPVVAQIKY